MGQCIFGAKILHDPRKEIERILVRIDCKKLGNKLFTYKGLGNEDTVLQDVVYRLYPPKFEDYQLIINSCSLFETTSNSYIASLIKAICFIFLNEYAVAKSILLQQILTYPSSSHAFFHLGCVSLLLDEWTSAREYLTTCLKLDPANHEALLLFEQSNVKWYDPLYADILEKPKSFHHETKKILEKAKKIALQDDRCFQGFILLSQDNSQNNLRICNEYLQVIPFCYAAHIQKGQIAMSHGSYNLANKFFKTALNLQPEALLPLSSLALMALESKEYNQILQLSERFNEITHSQIGITNKREEQFVHVILKAKILALSKMDRLTEGLEMCNKQIKQTNFNYDYLQLKYQLLVEPRSNFVKQIQIVHEQIQLVQQKAMELRAVNLMLILYRGLVSEYMVVHPQLVFIDLIFD